MSNETLITIPSPEYRLGQQIEYMLMTNTVTSRVYDLDKEQWSYTLNNQSELITKSKITDWWSKR